MKIIGKKYFPITMLVFSFIAMLQSIRSGNTMETTLSILGFLTFLFLTVAVTVSVYKKADQK